MNGRLSNFFYALLSKEQLWGKKRYFFNRKIKFLLFLIKKLICLYISLVLKINTLYEKWKKNIFDAFKWKPKKIHSRKSIFFYVDWSFRNKLSLRQIFSYHTNYFLPDFPKKRRAKWAMKGSYLGVYFETKFAWVGLCLYFFPI